MSPVPHSDRITLPNDQDASGRSFGIEELEAVSRVLRSGTLVSTKGDFVKQFEEKFADRMGLPHATACTSGTAAIHAALAALDLEPGDEVITTPVTDMGALAPILYQGLIPVFADVDPATLNLTASTIEKRLSERTRAIIVTHLFGNPCEMAAIQRLARERGLRVIEDCAQAFLAEDGGKLVGQFGDLACFSLQQGKHITCGEGGIVLTKDADLARRVFLFVNKAWGYGDAKPDHEFLALNGRLSELQGAVALAQLDKLDHSVRVRCDRASELNTQLDGTPGLRLPLVRPQSRHVYWKFPLWIDPDAMACTVDEFGAALRSRGIACAPRYVQKPAFSCGVFRNRRTLGTSRWPFDLARPDALDWDPERFQGVWRGLARVVVLPINERYESHHVSWLAGQIREAAGSAARLAA